MLGNQKSNTNTSKFVGEYFLLRVAYKYVQNRFVNYCKINSWVTGRVPQLTYKVPEVVVGWLVGDTPLLGGIRVTHFTYLVQKK